MRDRGNWTLRSSEYLRQVAGVLERLREHWPLTLRQVYYQIVAAGIVPNRKQEYSKLSALLTKARLDGLISWDAIEDRTRATLHSGGWESAEDFISQQKRKFLAGYRRDLLQTQERALELWVEKDALSRLCHDVAFDYCVPVIVARGFSSVSYVHECRKRVESRAVPTLILYFGDLDPSGWFMLPAMMETLQEEMGLGNLIEAQRCALTAEQVEEHGLIRNPDAIKPGDPRTDKYLPLFGDLAVELDALEPGILQSIVRDSIEEALDMELFEGEKEKETQDRAFLQAKRRKVLKML